ncbi:MAG: ATP-binding protein [Marinilabiliales bacterium]|nr:MAG: ATP-binding protein [Marinilabiliales bacterium]
MIQSLYIKNFLSFRDGVTFSFEAANDKSFDEYHVVEMANGVRLLKFGVVYGSNASGKSNLINAFNFLRQFWFQDRSSKDDETGVVPFLLNESNNSLETDFHLIFYVNNLKYIYRLSLSDKRVFSETLDYYPGTQPANLFQRELSDGKSKILFGKKLKITSAELEAIQVKCLPNISFFKAYNMINFSVQKIDDVIGWMKKSFLQSVEPLTGLQRYTENLVREDINSKHHIIEFLQAADFNISDIRSRTSIRNLSSDEIPKFSPYGTQNVINEPRIQILSTDFVHSVTDDAETKEYLLPLSSQSDGTKRVFGLSGLLYTVINNNAFLPVDELESKLHPRLIEFMIQYFLRNSDQAQLLVTTHYDNLFDEDDLLRKDNFWFTEKNSEGSTSIYRLSDFKGLGRISSLQKAYKYGRFGAVPEID